MQKCLITGDYDNSCTCALMSMLKMSMAIMSVVVLVRRMRSHRYKHLNVGVKYQKGELCILAEACSWVFGWRHWLRIVLVCRIIDMESTTTRRARLVSWFNWARSSLNSISRTSSDLLAWAQRSPSKKGDSESTLWVSICLSLKEGQRGKLTQQLQASTLLTWAERHPPDSSAIWRVRGVWGKWSESPAPGQSYCLQSTLCRCYCHSQI